MTATLLSRFKQKLTALTLIPAGGGRFELEANGELIYSKLQTGTFPDEQAMVAAVAAKLAGR